MPSIYATDMNKVIQALMSLGLSDKEAHVYLALYKIGKGTAYEIAKESGIKRPTVYVLVEELRKRGLALMVPHSKKQLYIARDPNEFIQEYQSKIVRNGQDLLSMLPKLSRPDNDIVVFKGKGALVQGLSYGMHGIKDKKMIALYAGVRKHVKVAPEYYEHFERIYDLGIRLHSIIPDDAGNHAFDKHETHYQFRYTKIPAKDFSPSSSVEVFDDIVKHIFHRKREVTVIHDKGLADLYRQIFALLTK